MKPSLWWIGSHWHVCHLARLTLPSLSPSLSACQDRRWQQGPPGESLAPGEAPFAALRGESPPPAVFQDRRTAVTAQTPATRRGLSHKTSKASAAMKTQVRGALSIFTAPLLGDCSHYTQLPRHSFIFHAAQSVIQNVPSILQLTCPNDWVTV